MARAYRTRSGPAFILEAGEQITFDGGGRHLVVMACGDETYVVMPYWATRSEIRRLDDGPLPDR